MYREEAKKHGLSEGICVDKCSKVVYVGIIPLLARTDISGVFMTFAWQFGCLLFQNFKRTKVPLRVFCRRTQIPNLFSERTTPYNAFLSVFFTGALHSLMLKRQYRFAFAFILFELCPNRLPLVNRQRTISCWQKFSAEFLSKHKMWQRSCPRSMIVGQPLVPGR